MSYLVVPVQVDALFLNQGISGIGQDIDFKELPYYNQAKEAFINQDKPFLAESIIRQPFTNDSLYLEKGVHLHWTLPNLVTTSRQINNRTVFPAAPNRWYIIKKKNGITEEWVVESDYMWNPNDNNCPLHRLCTAPAKPDLNLTGGDQPYVYLGKKYTLQEWLNVAHDKKNYWPNAHEEYLTATGWGSLAFDTFYANSRSVFGMHDADDGTANKTQTFRYTILGWYDKESDAFKHDFIRSLLTEWKSKLTKEMEAADRLELFTEHINASVLNLDNATVSDAQISQITNTVCYGFIDMHHSTDAFPATGNINLSVATTPAEAISAILIDSRRQEQLSVAGQLIEEERLEAILNFDEINDLRLDLAHRLRETRHQNGYIPREGLINWRIILEDVSANAKPGEADDNPEDETETDSQLLRPSPELTALEKSLRNAQYRYDLTRHELSSTLDALYIDWSRYMMCMYPPEGQTRDYPDADEIRFHIRNGSLKNAKELRNELGTYPNLKNKDTITQTGASLGSKIGGLITRINNELEALNEQLHIKYPKKNYKLVQEIGTQYWEALPPTVVLFKDDADKQENELLKFSGRLLTKDKRTDFLLIENRNVLYDGMLQKSGFSVKPLLNCIKNVKTTDQTVFGQSASAVNAWHTFRVEWKAELFPLATGNELTRSTRKFDTGFITKNYSLPEDGVDLDIHPSLNGLSLLAAGSVYTGSSFVTDTIFKGYVKKLENFEKNNGDDNIPGARRAKRYLEKLNNTTLLGLTLTGFNDAMLQQKTITRLAAADPFGFKTHRSFADDVAAVLSGGEGKSPDPKLAYNPVRSGAVKISAIRLIDTFGRSRDINPTRVITPTPNKIAQKENWVNMPPRLSQPATMSMRWVESPTRVLTQDTGPKILDSPICGWMLPVYMNQRIEFFDASGKHLGAITHKGKWENSVFDYEVAQAKSLNFISNAPLKKVIEWIIGRASDTSFRETFIRLFQATANNILPESVSNYSLFEIIAGTPIAVTQLNLNLFLKGKPSFDVSWNILRSELSHKTGRHSKGFTQIEFPFVLGDFHQLNDGVIAYWKNKGQDLDGPVYFNNARYAVLNHSAFGDAGGDALEHEASTPGIAGENQSQKELKLPPGLADELEYRYNKRLTFTEMLKELAKNGNLCKHEFTRRYVKNGTKYWDILIAEKLIRLTDNEHEDIQRSLDNVNLTCTIDEPAQLFTVLMHPKGTVHLTTGILPVKKMQLPEESFKRALRSIELSFLAAPVITPLNQLQLSLHQDSRFEWSWLKAEKKKKEVCSESNQPAFKRTLQRPHLQIEHFAKVWNNYYTGENQSGLMPAEAWKRMTEFDFIEKAKVYGKEGFAFFKHDKFTEAKKQLEQLDTQKQKATNETEVRKHELVQLLEPLLPALIKSINVFEAKAATVIPQCITEGWLVIKSTR